MSLASEQPGLDARDHPLGGLAMTIAGARVLCRPSGALWLPGSSTLVAADLHLEKGSAYAARGQMLPPYDSAETLNRLEAEVAALAPGRIVLLGDTFHDRGAEGRLSVRDAARLALLASHRQLIFVTGNHDAEGPASLPGDTVAQLDTDGLRLVHEPTAAPARAELAGHLHPCARLRGHALSVRRRCFVTDGARMILPAFGAFAGGLNVRDAAFSALFEHGPLALVLSKDRVHPIGWSSLRGD